MSASEETASGVSSVVSDSSQPERTKRAAKASQPKR